jgi:EamA domain-containing membrane protein RarD
MVPKKKSPTISMNSAIPTKTDFMSSYITGRLGFYFAIVIFQNSLSAQQLGYHAYIMYSLIE